MCACIEATVDNIQWFRDACHTTWYEKDTPTKRKAPTADHDVDHLPVLPKPVKYNMSQYPEKITLYVLYKSTQGWKRHQKSVDTSIFNPDDSEFANNIKEAVLPLAKYLKEFHISHQPPVDEGGDEDDAAGAEEEGDE